MDQLTKTKWDELNVLYRYDTINYTNSINLYLTEYKIIKRTEYGVWIEFNCDKKFVNLEARKQFACATKEAAFISFKRRKARQISILTSQLNRAKKAALLTIEKDSISDYSLNEL